MNNSESRMEAVSPLPAGFTNCGVVVGMDMFWFSEPGIAIVVPFCGFSVADPAATLKSEKSAAIWNNTVMTMSAISLFPKNLGNGANQPILSLPTVFLTIISRGSAYRTELSIQRS